jgi:hypothetical protein
LWHQPAPQNPNLLNVVRRVNANDYALMRRLRELTYSEAVTVFKECYKTLGPGHGCASALWIGRPTCVNSQGDRQSSYIPCRIARWRFHSSQMQKQRSVWDAELMIDVLSELAFEGAPAVPFDSGSDASLIKDDQAKASESLHVEARKPAHQFATYVLRQSAIAGRGKAAREPQWSIQSATCLG